MLKKKNSIYSWSYNYYSFIKLIRLACIPHPLIDGLIIVAISEKTIKYSCQAGKLEQSESTYQCIDTGAWNNTLPPKCIRKDSKTIYH